MHSSSKTYCPVLKEPNWQNQETSKDHLLPNLGHFPQLNYAYVILIPTPTPPPTPSHTSFSDVLLALTILSQFSYIE